MSKELILIPKDRYQSMLNEIDSFKTPDDSVKDTEHEKANNSRDNSDPLEQLEHKKDENVGIQPSVAHSSKLFVKQPLQELLQNRLKQSKKKGTVNERKKKKVSKAFPGKKYAEIKLLNGVHKKKNKPIREQKIEPKNEITC